MAAEAKRAAGRRYAAAGDWPSAAVALRAAHAAEASECARVRMALALARAHHAAWAAGAAWADADAACAYFAIAFRRDQDPPPPRKTALHVLEAAAALVGTGRRVHAVETVRSILPNAIDEPTTVQEHAVLWAATLLSEARGDADDTVLAYLKWLFDNSGSAAYVDEESENVDEVDIALGLCAPAAFPRWVVALLLARSYASAQRGVEATAMLQSAMTEALQVDAPLQASTAELSELRWAGDDRVWLRAAEVLLQARQPLAAARCLRLAADAYEARIKRPFLKRLLADRAQRLADIDGGVDDDGDDAHEAAAHTFASLATAVTVATVDSTHLIVPQGLRLKGGPSNVPAVRAAALVGAPVEAGKPSSRRAARLARLAKAPEKAPLTFEERLTDAPWDFRVYPCPAMPKRHRRDEGHLYRTKAYAERLAHEGHVAAKSLGAALLAEPWDVSTRRRAAEWYPATALAAALAAEDLRLTRMQALARSALARMAARGLRLERDAAAAIEAAKYFRLQAFLRRTMTSGLQRVFVLWQQRARASRLEKVLAAKCIAIRFRLKRAAERFAMLLRHQAIFDAVEGRRPQERRALRRLRALAVRRAAWRRAATALQSLFARPLLARRFVARLVAAKRQVTDAWVTRQLSAAVRGLVRGCAARVAQRQVRAYLARGACGRHLARARDSRRKVTLMLRRRFEKSVGVVFDELKRYVAACRDARRADAAKTVQKKWRDGRVSRAALKFQHKRRTLVSKLRRRALRTAHACFDALKKHRAAKMLQRCAAAYLARRAAHRLRQRRAKAHKLRRRVLRHGQAHCLERWASFHKVAKPAVVKLQCSARCAAARKATRKRRHDVARMAAAFGRRELKTRGKCFLGWRLDARRERRARTLTRALRCHVAKMHFRRLLRQRRRDVERIRLCVGNSEDRTKAAFFQKLAAHRRRERAARSVARFLRFAAATATVRSLAARRRRDVARIRLMLGKSTARGLLRCWRALCAHARREGRAKRIQRQARVSARRNALQRCLEKRRGDLAKMRMAVGRRDHRTFLKCFPAWRAETAAKARRRILDARAAFAATLVDGVVAAAKCACERQVAAAFLARRLALLHSARRAARLARFRLARDQGAQTTLLLNRRRRAWRALVDATALARVDKLVAAAHRQGRAAAAALAVNVVGPACDDVQRAGKPDQPLAKPVERGAPASPESTRQTATAGARPSPLRRKSLSKMRAATAALPVDAAPGGRRSRTSELSAPRQRGALRREFTSAAYCSARTALARCGVVTWRPDALTAGELRSLAATAAAVVVDAGATPETVLGAVQALYERWAAARGDEMLFSRPPPKLIVLGDQRPAATVGPSAEAAQEGQALRTSGRARSALDDVRALAALGDLCARGALASVSMHGVKLGCCAAFAFSVAVSTWSPASRLEHLCLEDADVGPASIAVLLEALAMRSRRAGAHTIEAAEGAATGAARGDETGAETDEERGAETNDGASPAEGEGPSPLRTLNLSGCRVGGSLAVGRALGALLRSPAAAELVELSLCRANLDAHTVRLIFEPQPPAAGARPFAPVLETLRLRDNPRVGDCGAVHVARAVFGVCGAPDAAKAEGGAFDGAGGGASDGGGPLTPRARPRCPSLSRLDVHGCGVGPGAADAMAQMLEDALDASGAAAHDEVQLLDASQHVAPWQCAPADARPAAHVSLTLTGNAALGAAAVRRLARLAARAPQRLGVQVDADAASDVDGWVLRGLKHGDAVGLAAHGPILAALTAADIDAGKTFGASRVADVFSSTAASCDFY
ncbi:hypothetical protein M885DRAFT_622480 [Pelagophyceae sp. CCMP2097]|nr:hypothetical protein M885DRAFT_622480 [Pelagophyceae sp. CCMP2097]